VAKLVLPLMPSKLGYYIDNDKDFAQVLPKIKKKKL